MTRKKSGRAARSAGVPRPVYEWDRRKDEGPEAYQAFLVYRDIGQGRRSIQAVRERYAKGTGFLRLLGRWSSRHSWTFRVDAWDAQLQRIADERIREIFTEQIERHRVIGDAGLAAVSEALNLTLQELRQAKAEAPSFASVIAAAATIVELQQKIAAQAVERLERVQAGGPAAGAREELARRLNLMAAARARGRAALEAAQAPAPEVQALQEVPRGGAPAPGAS